MNNPICVNCKKEFIKHKKKQKFCSVHCSIIFYTDTRLKNLTNHIPPKHRPWDGKTRPDFKGAKHPLWKGGRQKTGYGYINLYLPEHPKSHKNSYPEHRYIMEQYLGRKLKSSEIVHHINRNKLDNRIENLKVISHSEHTKIHKPSRWT